MRVYDVLSAEICPLGLKMEMYILPMGIMNNNSVLMQPLVAGSVSVAERRSRGGFDP